MAISFSRYVDITSGVGAGSSVRQRDLILRLFTTNELVPTGTVMEFSNASDVSDYFGSTSQEALRATFYFGFISKTVSRPQSIAFARWINVDVGAMIFGSEAATALTDYQAITAGGFTITLEGVDGVVTGLDLSGAASLTDVATTLQTDIRAVGGTFSAVEVTYNATASRFEFDSGNTGEESISVTDGAQDPLSIIGWGATATFSMGAGAETPVESVTDLTEVTNNYGSFIFMATLTLEQHVAIASWNQAQNVMFQYHVATTAANAATWAAALDDYAGTGVTLLSAQANDYVEMLPSMVLASTNYSNRASVQNYMFQQYSPIPSSVTTNANADLYDGLRVNYYGQTQTAGQQIAFYQRGVLGGGATAPVDMNTYANEQWMKDRAGSLIMGLLLGQRVSANASGRTAVLANVRTVIDEGLNNGTISVGKPLTQNQILFITEQTGDENAFHQVINAGYWNDARIDSDTDTNGIVSFKVVYQIIYSKDDVVRLVEGTHTLI